MVRARRGVRAILVLLLFFAFFTSVWVSTFAFRSFWDPLVDQINYGKEPSSRSDRSEYLNDIIRASSLARHDATCQSSALSAEWQKLCAEKFTDAADELILRDGLAHIVQIGAHVGFEKNDPLSVGLLRFMQYFPSEIKMNFHWTFVEPSPPNFKRLKANLRNWTACSVNAINAAVVPSEMGRNSHGSDSESQGTMTFYSISESIDPETGKDSKSGKKLPFWITQVSSLDTAPIMFNRNVFSKRGLNVHDYIVETNVTTMTYSKLMKSVMQGDDKVENDVQPLLVLLDTEGYDCMIIKGISAESKFTPKFFIYEDHQCDRSSVSREEVKRYLEDTLGYAVFKMPESNTVAVKKSLMPN